MPRNTEYLILAYGFAATVILIYSTWIYLKLRVIDRKMDELRRRGNRAA